MSKPQLTGLPGAPPDLPQPSGCRYGLSWKQHHLWWSVLWQCQEARSSCNYSWEKIYEEKTYFERNLKICHNILWSKWTCFMFYSMFYCTEWNLMITNNNNPFRIWFLCPLHTDSQCCSIYLSLYFHFQRMNKIPTVLFLNCRENIPKVQWKIQ